MFTATLTAVPATIVISKLIQPEIHYSRFGDGEVVKIEQDDTSLLEAAMKGAQNGCKVILTVSMVLIGFYSVLSLFDQFIGTRGLIRNTMTKFVIISLYRVRVQPGRS